MVSGHPDAIVSAIAVIVGLHFFGLIPAFQSQRFAAVGGAMILLGVSSLFLAPSVAIASMGAALALRAAVVGLGCAIILWVGILALVMATRRHLRHTTA